MNASEVWMFATGGYVGISLCGFLVSRERQKYAYLLLAVFWAVGLGALIADSHVSRRPSPLPAHRLSTLMVALPQLDRQYKR